MHNFAVVLVSMACVGYGRRVKQSLDNLQAGMFKPHHTSAAAFSPVGARGARSPSRHSAGNAAHPTALSRRNRPVHRFSAVSMKDDINDLPKGVKLSEISKAGLPKGVKLGDISKAKAQAEAGVKVNVKKNSVQMVQAPEDAAPMPSEAPWYVDDPAPAPTPIEKNIETEPASSVPAAEPVDKTSGAASPSAAVGTPAPAAPAEIRSEESGAPAPEPAAPVEVNVAAAPEPAAPVEVNRAPAPEPAAPVEVSRSPAPEPAGPVEMNSETAALETAAPVEFSSPAPEPAAPVEVNGAPAPEAVAPLEMKSEESAPAPAAPVEFSSPAPEPAAQVDVNGAVAPEPAAPVEVKSEEPAPAPAALEGMSSEAAAPMPAETLASAPVPVESAEMSQEAQRPAPMETNSQESPLLQASEEERAEAEGGLALAEEEEEPFEALKIEDFINTKWIATLTRSNDSWFPLAPGSKEREFVLLEDGNVIWPTIGKGGGPGCVGKWEYKGDYIEFQRITGWKTLLGMLFGGFDTYTADIEMKYVKVTDNLQFEISGYMRSFNAYQPIQNMASFTAIRQPGRFVMTSEEDEP